GRQNVGGLRYNHVQPESMRMPSWAFAVVRILRTGRRNMPSARTPDPAPAGSSPRSTTPPSPAGETDPPSALVPALAAAFGGLRLIEVPGDWPPYDCEVHGTACPAAREISVPSLCAHRERGAPEDADPPGPSLTFSAGRPADGPAD